MSLVLICPSPEEAAALDETLNRDFAKYSAMGACVILFENGEVSYVYTTGVQKLGGDPISPQCGFRVGSISKMVSCIGIMKLVEEGKCTLDDDLSDLLGFPVLITAVLAVMYAPWLIYEAVKKKMSVW